MMLYVFYHSGVGQHGAKIIVEVEEGIRLEEMFDNWVNIQIGECPVPGSAGYEMQIGRWKMLKAKLDIIVFMESSGIDYEIKAYKSIDVG